MKTVLSLFFALWMASVWSATTRIVDVNDPGAPFQSINAAIAAAAGGDTVLVRPGVYEEAVVVDKGISLIGSGPDTTRIEAIGDGIEWDVPGGSGEIAGFYVRGSAIGIDVLAEVTDLTIRNNVIANCGAEGVLLRGGTGAAVTVVASNNTVYSNVGWGINLTGSNTQATLYNNIVMNNIAGGVRRDGPAGDLILLYNDVLGNVGVGYGGVDAGTNDFSADPLFVDEGIGDFHLGPGSPCLSAGTPDASFANPDGSRNDIGAFGGPGAASFWPFSFGAPQVSDVSADPMVVAPGDTFTLRARAQSQ